MRASFSFGSASHNCSVRWQLAGSLATPRRRGPIRPVTTGPFCGPRTIRQSRPIADESIDSANDKIAVQAIFRDSSGM